MSEHHYNHGMLIQKVESATNNIDKLKALIEYMEHHAHDVQSFLHHIEQGSVYHGRAID